jgi:uncharacterized protein YecE (DUF72 family)
MPETDITDLRLGLCGWNGSQRTYFEDFDCIEIQSTFYDPPTLQVARKWRAAAPVDFHYCIKAWQLITHTAASPTYRRLRSPLPAGDRDAVGSFRPTSKSGRPGYALLKLRAPSMRGSSSSNVRSPFSLRAKISSTAPLFF